MAGHSQWANRKHRKAKQDAKKGKLFSKMSKKITVAARKGGGDQELNPTLRMAVEKALSLGVPKDNIERAIKKGTGELEGGQLEEFQYEGYGPGGVALLLDIVTDNRNRTASEIRHLLSEYGGNLGQSGCVSWMFTRKGKIVIKSTNGEIDEDELFLSAAEGGAEDLKNLDESFEVLTPYDNLMQVRESLEDDYPIENSGFTYVTDNYVKISGTEAQRLLKLLDELEDQEDVQEIYGNFDIDEREWEEYEAS